MSGLLIVDDEAIIATDLEDRLASNGYEVVGIATSGEKAVRLTADLRPDLVIMDIVMPGRLDGIAAAAAIREQYSTPVVFLTAHSDEEFMDRAKAVGPLGYILKPFNEAQIYATLEIALHNSLLERQLRESEARYRAIVDQVEDLICRFDPDLQLRFCNQATRQMFASSAADLARARFTDLLPDDKVDAFRRCTAGLGPERQTALFEHAVDSTQSGRCWLQWSLRVLLDEAGRPTEYQAVGRDITVRMGIEDTLRKSNRALEQQLEVDNRDLAAKNAQLAELETTLKVLMRYKEADRDSVQQSVISNVQGLILPFVERVRQCLNDPNALAYLEVVESGLADIVSPFMRRMASTFANLTPAEIRVSHFIKQGLTTKEIADLLNLSTRTIEAYRNSIRKKMGIANRKVNLRSYLQPFEEF
ncbi:MAG: response regulator [Desulfosarcinaceae bacterium]|nr:response regulator [Desulfosarcinaceae bacterium]